MKVLLIGPLPLPINGCSHANQILLKNLKERNFRFSAIDTNTNVISGKQGSKFSVKKAFLFIQTYFLTYKIFYNTVIYVTPGQTFFGVCKYAPFLVLCMILNKPYIIHLHGNHLGKEYAGLHGIKKKIFSFLISRASAGIVLSKSLSVNFKNLLPPGNVHIIENFVDDSLLMIPLKKNADQLRIVYLSNLMLEKGIIELLDALIVLKGKKINFHLTVAGAMEQGIENEFNTRYQLLSNQINYVGTVSGDKKKQVLAEANVFVLPTYYKMEGQPICLLEGMATGNIIVTTAHAGIPDVVNDSNGFFVKKRSSHEIADCLENIGGRLSEMVNVYSEHNMKYIADKFTEKNFTDKILTVLHAVSKA